MWFVSSILARVKYARNIFTSRLSCAHTCATAVIVISSAPSFPHFNLPIYPKIQTGDGASRYNFGCRVCREEAREREDNRILKLISDMRRSGRRESESVCIRKIRYALLGLRATRAVVRSADSCGQKALLQM